MNWLLEIQFRRNSQICSIDAHEGDKTFSGGQYIHVTIFVKYNSFQKSNKC